MNTLVRWFVNNPIAANALMLAILFGGFVGLSSITKETFPTHVENKIRINMVYPGAAPSEVEQQLVVRIEESIADLPGIFQVRSWAREGFGSVEVDVTEGHDVRELLNDIKGRVDAINTFPPAAERPTISQMVFRPTLMWAALYGDTDLRELKRLAFQIRDEMSLLEGVSEVRLTGLKVDEVAIEISEENLRRYNLSFSEVAQAVRETSLNVPAGTIKSKDGDIQIQTRAQAFDQDDFEHIVVRSNMDGSQLRLSDVADVRDGFSEQDRYFSMNGKRGLNIEIKISDDPLLFEGTANAKKYIEDFNKLLPDDIVFKINFESKNMFDSRFNLLKDNALSGLVLVFIILVLFLRPMLAFWVVAGIATTFAGALWLLPLFGVSINMLSMFAFIMVLGIVVDDAIIVGESVYRHQQRGETGAEAASSGARSVLRPVMLAVISTVIFFMPMMTVPSDVLVYTRSIFFVVFLCLFFSLVESLFVLPSHLSHLKPAKPATRQPFILLEKLRKQFGGRLDHFAIAVYKPALRNALRNKLPVGLIFLAVFVISVTLMLAGWVGVRMFPNVPQPFVMVNFRMPDGTAFECTEEVANHVRRQIDILRSDPDLLAKNGGQPFIREVNRNLNGVSANVFIGLHSAEFRALGTAEITDALRALIGPLPEVKSYSLSGNLNDSGPEITLNLNMLSNLRADQQAAVDAISAALEAYPGVHNVRSDLESARTEIELELKPYAETLGITLGEVARQVRQGFYGEEVQRIPRSKEDVRVMLRYAVEERRTLDSLDTMRVRTRDGREVPLSAVAELKLVPGVSTIRRVDRRRNIVLTAEVSEGNDAKSIIVDLLENNLDQWKQAHTGLKLSMDGSLRSQAKFEDNFVKDFGKFSLITLVIFAIAFRSLFQPFLILLAIPFGFVGAILGHVVLGFDISFFSFFGFLACAGVVVNDNLVLIERINTLRSRGEAVFDAVVDAGVDRFRPIILTSVTTFVGLMPILIFERSEQAQFLKPMVVSLSFGVLFSTVVTLFLVPMGYMAGQNSKTALDRVFAKLLQRHANKGRPAT